MFRPIPLAMVAFVLSASLLLAAESAGPLSPKQSAEKIKLADPDLRIELVASEPAINSPVAMTWDAAGSMYVVEMSDYPLAESGGRVQKLRDADHDGTYETVTTFADGLSFPTSALPWKDGLLVTCAPDILFFRDTDNDGKSDERRVLFTGFVTGNQQLRVNGLYWGLDNWVYGANGRSGGDVRRPEDPADKTTSLRRHDFRFKPDTGEFEAIAGFSQFGTARDDFGHRFLSWNTVPIRHAALEEKDLNRNPLLTSGESIALIAEASDTGRVFPISSPPRTFNRERTDYFNASCGLTIFRGHGLGKAYQGNAFVGEPLTNLVHRKTLSPDGPTFVARRGESDAEFLASTDNWFHPVNLATGPDGCLYVADFYREWVEHPNFVQESLRGNVDFRFGNEHGRVWRIHHHTFQIAPARDLTKLTATQLVQELASENAWVRDTAQRLLVDKKDPAVLPALILQSKNAATSVSRAQAIWTLAGIGDLSNDSLTAALGDASPAVREQAVAIIRVADKQADKATSLLLALASDKDPQVRYQVALAAGDLSTKESLSTLAQLATQDASNSWMRLAILSGLGNTAEPFLQTLAKNHADFLQTDSPAQQELLQQVAVLIGAQQKPEELASVCKLLKAHPSAALPLLAGLSEGLARHHQSLLDGLSAEDRPAIETILESAAQTVTNKKASPQQRLLAFRVVLRLKPSAGVPLVESLLSLEESPTLQSAGAWGVGELADPDLVASVLERWGTFPINTRRELLVALARKPALVALLLHAIEEGQIAAAEVDFTTREALLRVPDPTLQATAAKLLKSQENTDRLAVVKKYQEALSLTGDSREGAKLFSLHCLGCHQVQGKGSRVGPELSGIASRPKPALLIDVLSPSQEVSPDFVNYIVVTKEGQIFAGLLSADTAAGVRLRRQQGGEDFIVRDNIEELRVNNKSLMPDGFEEKLTPQDFAHLLQFLQRPSPLP